ncbi:hypothetical protein MHBO_004024 [Bonamia ostreae]|uniref:Activator of Hsp90 ATPase AHSA1-like N-terminal domain-containing protein n=1 Tax=Bonamia ostreae TaxID=126728 RepID=A0ABV2ASH2_9EUKA
MDKKTSKDYESMVDNSKYYAFNSRHSETEAPKKLSDITLKPKKDCVKNEGSCLSDWNKQKTWEERDYSKESIEKLKKILTGKVLSSDDFSFRLTEISKLDGKTIVLFVRGKKRFSIDLAIKGKWVAEDDEEVKGTFEIPLFEESDDFELQVKTDKRTKKDFDARRSFLKTKKHFERILGAFESEFRAK